MENGTQLKDKVPPHSMEAEQATLGALLLDWSAVSDIVTMLRPDRFYSLQNQIIYQAMITLFGLSVKGDTLTVINELTKEGNLEKAGGAAYLASLTDTVPTSANVQYYAQIVLDQAYRRDLIKISSEMHASSFDETHDSQILIEEAEKKIFALSERNETTKVHDMNEVMTTTIDLIDKRYKSKNAFTGVPSGFHQLDTMTSGFQNSGLIIIGARPSIGKTALALSMMEYITIDKNIPCGFFSLEMSYQSIGQRLLSQESRIPGGKLKSGLLQLKDFQKLQDAAGRCFKAPLFIIDTPNMKLIDLRAMARRLVANHDVKIIFIDYIGLITTEDTSAPVYEQVAEISKSLKALARELDIPIVALSQVSRDAEGEEPNLAQLRGSGSVEQDADVVIFIHRDRKCEDPVQPAKLIIAKQRNGATGPVDIVFVPACTKYENKQEQ
ncbi:MAG: replicative DNA helicase [Treponema sp.]|nr:replicative DNA helicase [Treponema sp.]